jgi:hypothetical protein
MEPVMLRRIGIAVLLFLLPAAGRAADPPEHLLPATAQVYLRWDGVEAHRAAYEKTALGKTFQGDTGKFVASVFDQLQEFLGGAVVTELLKGTPPDKLQKIQADAVKAPKLLAALGKHGVILAAELRGVEPPDVRVTLIVPDAGDEAESFMAALRLAASLAQQPIQERTIEGRTVFQPAKGPVSVAWWVEGKHVVITAGTAAPDAMIKALGGTGDRLSDTALFKRVAGFRDFETGTRAFVDLAGLAKVAGARNKDVARLSTDLGGDAVKSLVLYSGFDGPVEHGLMELDFSGPRKGLLRLLDGKPFRLGDVPPLPADTAGWTMTHFDPGVAYDEGVRAAETIVGLLSPNDLPKLKEGLKGLDDTLGVNLRQDLLGALGDQFVQCSSATDGPLFFGNTYLIKVKDPEKLQTSLEQALKGVAKQTGRDISSKKRTYHGVTLHEIHVRQQGFIFLPTYAIHKGWLAVAYYPQPVQGFVLRANGELPAWKPDAPTREAFAKLPQEFTTVSVSDPRPTVKQVLALAPLVGAAVDSSLPGSNFDVGLLPNGHEATRHLFPNVTVVTTGKDSLRLESRASLALPLDLGNTDTLAAVELLVIFSFRVIR